MSNFSNLQIPPPANWQDFKTLCCDLWRAIWKDPNTQKNGRQGQQQNGVNIYGRVEQKKSGQVYSVREKIITQINRLLKMR